MKSIVSWLRRRGKSLSPATEGASDGLSRLPLELHFYVLEHLEASHFATALNVCRSWRYIWLSDEVWPWLAERWLPGLCEQIRLTVTATEEASEMFRRILVRRELRIHGRFSYALYNGMKLETDKFFKLSKSIPRDEGGTHVYTDVREPEPDLDRFSRFRLYSNGRIAWWPEPYALPYIAVVDDLRARNRRVYSFPGHRGDQQGYQAALGNKLFIMGKERTLHAWHLESDAHHSIELPYHWKRCLTEGETVLIISKDSAVYLWNFGQDFQQVDVSRIYERASVTWGDQGDFAPSVLGPHRVGLWLRWANTGIDFILHPTLKNVFFIVTLRGGVLTVHEFKDQKQINSYTLEEGALSRRALERSGQLRWEKVDSSGGYNLLSIYPLPTGSPAEDQDLDELCREISCRCRTWWTVGGHTLITVCFNIYTRAFDVLRHQPSTYYSPRTFHIWNQQLFGAVRHYGPNGWIIASIKRYAGWSVAKALSSMPLYSTSSPKSSEAVLLSRRRKPLEEVELYGMDADAKVFQDVEYFFDANQAPHSEQKNLQDSPDTLRLVGDDEFLIFFKDNRYTAWCFGDKLKK